MSKRGQSQVELLQAGQQPMDDGPGINDPQLGAHEFTQQEIYNFHQAFKVFDVNGDGKISTEEIFEVLRNMGNEVSKERQKKITDAVAKVTKAKGNPGAYGAGDSYLDFYEFIQFMKIMDDYNKQESAVRSQAPPDRAGLVMEEKDDFPYGPGGFLDNYLSVPIKIRLDRSSRSVIGTLAWLFWIINLAHAVAASVIVAIGFDFWDQNPGDTDHNTLYLIVRIIRYVNFGNYFLFFYLLQLDGSPVGEAKKQVILEYFDKMSFAHSKGNYLKLVVRNIFAVNIAASVVFLIGLNMPGWTWTADFFQSQWQLWVISVVQIATAYLCFSTVFWFEARYQTATAGSALTVAFVDIVFFNLIRLGKALVKTAISLALLPLTFLLSFVWMLKSCCDRDEIQQGSFTDRYIRLSVRLCGV